MVDDTVEKIPAPAEPEYVRTGPVKLFFQCILALLVFLVLLVKLILFGPIIVISLASVIIRTLMALFRKWRGATE